MGAGYLILLGSLKFAGKKISSVYRGWGFERLIVLAMK